MLQSNTLAMIPGRFPLNWNFMLHVKYKDTENIKWNTIEQVHIMSKEKFQNCSNQ